MSSELRKLAKIVREVYSQLEEANITGGTATMTAGDGESYATPKILGKENRAVRMVKRWGMKQVSRPKRPSHTKGFDYL